ncbi:MAG TPA: Kazal-type serine protease inhibitor domain-containing protein [Kofleriaceae bacterium]|nr:Kazal-type serine protease inhibitor domain-containing protein [Kofleriaceae bacterium]
MRKASLFLSACALAALAACVDKTEPGKGEIDPELPPGSPLPPPAEGKADGVGTVLQISVESAHPYTNDLDRTYAIDLSARVPACATTARVHFPSIRTEAGYDFLHVLGSGGEVQQFDGDHTDTWSDWAPLGAARRLSLRLETDGSVVKDGFRADAVEYQTHVQCPLPPQQACPAGQVDVTPAPGPCECRGATQCAPDASVVLEHVVGGGFTGTINGHRATGTTAATVVYKPGQPDQVTTIGTIDHARLQAVVDFVVAGGYLGRTGASESSDWNETVKASIAPRTYASTRAQGTHPADDAALIAKIDELFTCGGGGALTCSAGNTCDAGQCVAHTGSCICPTIYQPVCGNDGHTYSNACAAGCAATPVRHTGECGIVGDPCGGLLARACSADNRCRYAAGQFQPPFPEASGSCVAWNYCDAPADCAGLLHPSMPGSWSCTQNACAWHAGPAWHAFDRDATAHPYANRASEWHALTAPDGATKVHLVVNGTFELENGYDFLEVYSWRNNAWTLVKRYTGTVGPALTDELTGRYHYLRLVSDVSVTRYGFDVSAEWAN